MKNSKFYKKLGVAVLSIVGAVTLGVSSLTISSAKASYDYSTTAKSSEYVESLFSYAEGSGVTVTADNYMPSYYQVDGKAYDNGVLINFAKEGKVTVNKTFKENELKQIVKFQPVVSQENFNKTTEISEFNVTVYEEKTVGTEVKRVKSVTYKYYPTNLAFDTAQGLAVSASYLDGETLKTQTFAGNTCLNWENIKDATDTTPAVPNQLRNVAFMRKAGDRVRTFATVGQSFGGYAKKSPLVIGYEKLSGGEIVATAPSYDSGVNSLYTGEVSGMGVIRQLNKAYGLPSGISEEDYNSYYVGLVENVVFDGFTANADLKIEFEVVSGSGSILINEIAGENLSESLRIKNSYKAYGGVEYKIPTPKFYKNGVLSADDVDVYYEVKDLSKQESEQTLVSKTLLNKNAKVTFNLGGEYVIDYTLENGGEKYQKRQVVELVNGSEFDVDKVSVKITNNFDKLSVYEKTRGSQIEVGATAYSNIYLNGDSSSVKLDVYYGDQVAPINTFESLTKNKLYTLINAGVYKFVYTASDDLSSVVVEKTINVSNCYYQLIYADNVDWAMGDSENVPVINRDVVKFGDVDYGRNFFDNAQANAQVELKVKTPTSADFEEISDAEKLSGYEFKEFGLHQFRYKLTYTAKLGGTVVVPNDSDYIEFKVNVVDVSAPSLSLVSGSALSNVVEISKDEKSINYKAQKGETATFGKFVAFDIVGAKQDLSSQIKTMLTFKAVDGTVTTSDITGALLNGGEFKFDNLGEYIFNVSVTDGFNVTGYAINVEVVDKIYSIVYNESYNDEYGSNVNISSAGFTVLDKFGNVDNEVTKKYVIKRNGEVIIEQNSLNFVPEKPGKYQIIMQALSGNVVVCQQEVAFSVIDKTAPVIMVSGEIKKKGVIGEQMSLATITAVDNSDDSKDVINSINIYDANGNEMNYYQGKFVADKAGEYTVVYSSIDSQGNVNKYSYVITITEEEQKEATVFGAPLWTVIYAGIALIAVISALVVMLVSLKKKTVIVLSDDDTTDDSTTSENTTSDDNTTDENA